MKKTLLGILVLLVVCFSSIAVMADGISIKMPTKGELTRYHEGNVSRVETTEFELSWLNAYGDYETVASWKSGEQSPYLPAGTYYLSVYQYGGNGLLFYGYSDFEVAEDESSPNVLVTLCPHEFIMITMEIPIPKKIYGCSYYDVVVYGDGSTGYGSGSVQNNKLVIHIWLYLNRAPESMTIRSTCSGEEVVYGFSSSPNMPCTGWIDFGGASLIELASYNEGGIENLIKPVVKSVPPAAQFPIQYSHRMRIFEGFDDVLKAGEVNEYLFTIPEGELVTNFVISSKNSDSPVSYVTVEIIGKDDSTVYYQINPTGGFSGIVDLEAGDYKLRVSSLHDNSGGYYIAANKVKI